MKSVFFIPVYDQVRELPGLLRELSAGHACDTILLVNNGSSDGSERLVRESGHPYLEVSRNRGVGHAMMLALEWALEGDYEVFGSLAANGKMQPTEMPRLLDPIRRGEADYTTGSRFLPGGASPNLPSFRRRSIPLVNVFARLLTGARLTDSTCGYRALRLDLLRRARFDWKAPWLWSYGLEYYLYAKVLLDGGIRWREVPITMRYPEAGVRYSKIPPVLGWWQMLRPWIVARFDGRGFEPPRGSS